MDLQNSVVLSKEECANQVSFLLTEDFFPTGIRMLDAWGKIPDGILSGNFVHLGHYDQCVNISENTRIGEIKGKYCLVELLNLQSTFMGYGACVPEVCDYKMGMEQAVICQTKDSYTTLDSSDWFLVTIFLLIGILMLLSTLYDIYSRKYLKTQRQEFILFSVLTNGQKLFDTNIGPDQISCLAGIRVLSMIWIIAGHKYYVFLFIPLRNSIYAFNLLYSHDSFYIQAAYLAVDTFLYLGGFVLAYQCFKNRNQLVLTIKTIPYFYMHRLLRLLPLMIVVFFIHLTIIRRLISGPMYPHIVEKMRQPCIDHWWSYFLFYQNYAYAERADKECLPHTWYLNVDVQLYLFTPLLIIPATKLLLDNQKFKCYCLFWATFLLSVFVPMFIMFDYPYKYQHTHTRISPYILGLVMGLFIQENRETPFKISKKLKTFAWTITAITMFICMYYIQNTQIYVDDHFANNMLITFGRPVWCACLSWIIFACVSGNAEKLNRFLSNRVFIVVGRLSFSMYLLQVLVLIITMGSSRTVAFLSFWHMFHGTISDVCMIIMLSVICVLAFESPTIALAKLLLERREPKFRKISKN